MRHLARKDLFYVEFGRNWVPDDIEKFYKPYIKDMPTQINSPRILVSSSLQGITFPSFQYDGVNQGHVDTSQNNNITTNWRATTNMQEATSKKITFTYKLLNGYINYWIMNDSLFYHNDMQNRDKFIGDISIRILDNNDLVMFTRVYKNCIMVGISDFEMSYSDNIQTFETFTVDMEYSAVETVFANPGNPNKFETNPSRFSGKVN